MVAVSSLSMNFLVIRISVQFKTLCARKSDSVFVNSMVSCCFIS